MRGISFNVYICIFTTSDTICLALGTCAAMTVYMFHVNLFLDSEDLGMVVNLPL